MNVDEYLETLKTLLLTHPLVKDFHVVGERRTATDAHLRVRAKLVKGFLLEFSEYVQHTIGDIQVITYSHHCTDADNNLFSRWDNTPHFPQLEGFPHHRHIGNPETVRPHSPMDIFRVLDKIAKLLPGNE